MTLQLLHSEFPYTVYEEKLIFFFISAAVGEVVTTAMIAEISPIVTGARGSLVTAVIEDATVQLL
jgi:hypothetical protein